MFEGVERHSSDFVHIVVYHLGPLVLVAVALYTTVFLMTRSAKRSDKSGKRKLTKARVNRLKGREARATNKPRRRH